MSRLLQLGPVGLLLLSCAACRVSNPLAVPTATPPPPTNTSEPTPSPVPEPDTPDGFDLFLAQVQQARVAERQGWVDPYIARLQTVPLTSEAQAILLWRGQAQTVQLVGDMNNWGATEAPFLTRLEGTDLWYLKIELEGEARLDYRFVIDGSDWQLDPLNPRTTTGFLGPSSELVMPSYETPAELLPPEKDVPSGPVNSHTLTSIYLDQVRTFFAYVPAGQIVGQRLPTVYIQDGGDYLNLLDAPAILDRLIVQRQIPPLVAVFVPPLNRRREYLSNQQYVSFLANELVPFIQAEYDTDPAPAKTGVLGASLGALAALQAAFARPDVFGLAAGQSGSYSLNGNEGALVRQIAAQRGTVQRLYLVVGTYETKVMLGQEIVDVLAANRRLAQVLQSHGFDYQYEERPEGHSWGLWQGTLGRALRFLFAGR